MPHDGYALLDCGEGERLEVFGPLTVRRAAPAALEKKALPSATWEAADLTFVRNETGSEGTWTARDGAVPESWLADIGPIRYELKPSAIGHVGVFPEQLPHWEWLIEQCAHAPEPLSILNGFAYTGGSTLACLKGCAQHQAQTGETHAASDTQKTTEVVHLDGSKSAVTWAKRNAALNECANSPVRWMVEDVLTFLEREIRRERRYDAFIFDPPAFGRGPKGAVWKWERDMPRLLTCMQSLMSDTPRFILLTSHALESNHTGLAHMLKDTFPEGDVSSAALPIIARQGGNDLPAGYMARMTFGAT